MARIKKKPQSATWIKNPSSKKYMERIGYDPDVI